MHGRLFGLIIAVILVAAVRAAPGVAFPFNSQVPKVARIAEPYSFQIAPTSFSQESGAALSYTLVDGPAWLNLNSQTRTLYGTPGQGDNGSKPFTIMAADRSGSASMSCTLIVTDNAPPRITGNISMVLAESGVLSTPHGLSIPPNDAFTISFGKGFFKAGSDQTQSYYATLADHTPLPSWLEFEESTLAFLGVAPGLMQGPQSWTINLISSDIAGFAGAVASFTITISANRFAFIPQYEEVVATADVPFSFEQLSKQLTLNGKTVLATQVQSVYATVPSWLTLYNDTLHLKGTPPAKFQPQNVAVTVRDIYGDVAIKTIILRAQDISFFVGQIGNLTAHAGELFIYNINQSIFSQPNLNISMDLGAAGSWLSYGPETFQLRGIPPVSARSQTFSLTISAASFESSAKESQSFELRLEAAPLGEIPVPSYVSSITSSTTSRSTSTTSTSIGEPTISNAANHSRIKAGVIVAIALACSIMLAVVVALIALLCRRKKIKGSQSPDRPTISKPMQSRDPTAGAWSKSQSHAEPHDLEKTATGLDQPPRLELPRQPSSLGTPHVEYQRSMVSSIGDGAVALQADPNIPVWGARTGTSHTPHDSYSAATQLARQNSRSSKERLSQFARLSPEKRTSKLLHSDYVHQGNSFWTSQHGSVLRLSRRQPRISSGLSISCRSSEGSFDTRGTSLLSARVSDFPKPPGVAKRKPCPISGLSVQDIDKRRSIRLVSRSDSITDDRPLVEKRQSFIRNRASSSTVSPLFASSRRSSNIREESLYPSSSLNRGRSQGTVFSATSSLEPRPPTRNPRRLASTSASFVPSFRHPNSALPSRFSSPVRGDAIPEDLDNSATTTTTTTTTTTAGPRTCTSTRTDTTSSSSSAAHLKEDARQAAEFAAQLALPRKSRSWVLPGEASPSPSPSTSSATRDRDAVRRKWAHKLKRDSRGHPVPREESPVRLTDVAQKFRRKKDGAGGPDAGGGQDARSGGERLSLLVSKDSINGPMRSRAARFGERKGGTVDVENELPGERYVGPGAEEGESEWEDVGSHRSSMISRGQDAEKHTPKSTFSGKAFL